MFSDFSRHAVFISVVLSLVVLSILCQIIIGVLYQKLIRDTENMATTENKLLKQCKTKFSNCYQLNSGDINIPVFVDKYMHQIRFCKVSIVNLNHLSGQLMLLSVFVAGSGVCKGIIDGETVGALLPYYIISLFGIYIYFSISSLVDSKNKSLVVRTNMIDYLENHLAKHLKWEPEIKNEKTGREEKEKFQQEEREELEMLLKEFLLE